MPDVPDLSRSLVPEDDGSLPGDVDMSAAHPARVYDYWLGGKDNFAADREAGEKAVEAYPDLVVAVRANRAFLGRAVRYLTGEAGIRQFLDIGTGIPSSSNTHEVAQAAAPESRVVYVDNDSMVLAHARALLRGTPRGSTAYLHADLRDVDDILNAAAETLDFSQPIAVMLLAILQYIPESADPYAIVSRLMAAVPPGSHLVISHPASDINAQEVAESMREYNERSPEQATPRSQADVSRFFAGLELLSPGLVAVPEWRPDSPPPPGSIAMWGGVARKNTPGAS
jgi:O-methyltransferase involved in polyketide biosynthesis